MVEREIKLAVTPSFRLPARSSPARRSPSRDPRAARRKRSRSWIDAGVVTRRLRSDLRTFRGLVQAEWDRLVEAANAPALLPEAKLPAGDVLPNLVHQPLRALTRQVKALRDGGSDDELHQLRIRVKRVRYAAEAVAPVLGKRARAAARRGGWA